MLGASSLPREGIAMASPVNDAAVDAALLPGVFAVGMSGPVSMGQAYESAGVSIGLVMYNAAAIEQRMQEIALTATTLTCALIVDMAGSSGG